MGIPKFFRWLSERYPLISKQTDASFIPEIDNLYLDMNGIIHTCTHGDGIVNKPLTEKEVQIKVFHYVDHLFQVIAPRRLLFIAVDGCAPRAKMNQQRQRRFKSAKEQQRLLDERKMQGLPIPDTPFDSNCITPGTEFMQKLSFNLRYFIRRKIKEDARWQRVQVIYSGHEVPGEGEHKIMEYIRQYKGGPDWDPQLRHCLYGLDADLIMLSLATHEPHFLLLREDTLTKKHRNEDISKVPLEKQPFILLHICLLREYLELDFKPTVDLNFPYDVERIVDDFILLCLFVGNDFLPQLPGLDIIDGALNKIFSVYKEVLSTLDDYLVSEGIVNVNNCLEVLRGLAKFEEEYFRSQDFTTLRLLEQPTEQNSSFLEIDQDIEKQAELENFVNEYTKISAEITKLAGIDSKPEEAVVAKYIKQKLAENAGSIPKDESNDWQKKYYEEKFEFAENEDQVKRTEQISEITKKYIEGVCWVIHYYFHGCVSWSWFFPHHFAPLAVDIVNVTDFKEIFELSQPFRPFEQLLAVLPPSSSGFLPKPYRELMTSPESPIIQYYPSDFKLDMSGKRHDWEAIACIPFIDEKLLLEAVDSRKIEQHLTDAEKERNTFGQLLLFEYDPQNNADYPSSMPGSFPDIKNCVSSCQSLTLPERVTNHPFRLLPGADDRLPCFPTLRTLLFQAKVLARPKEVVILQILVRDEIFEEIEQEQSRKPDINDVATQFIGRSVFIDWPFHKEALVVAVSNKEQLISKTRMPNDVLAWEKETKIKRELLLIRSGIQIDSIEICFHVKPLQGIKHKRDGSTEKQYQEKEEIFPFQLTIVDMPKSLVDIRYQDIPVPNLIQMFPIGTQVIYLGYDSYGALAKVIGHKKTGEIGIAVEKVSSDPSFGKRIAQQMQDLYLSLSAVASKFHISPRVLSMITGSVYVEPFHRNIGLNIKFTAKNQQVVGYTRRVERFDRNHSRSYGPIKSEWEFSSKALELIVEYKEKFPDVFEALERSRDQEILNVNELLGENGEERIKEIQEWLRTKDTARLPRVSAKGTKCMSNEAITAMEEAINQLLEKESQPSQIIKKYVRPQRIMLPLETTNNRGSVLYEEPQNGFQRFELGDRVVYLCTNTSIPFGARGFVVEIIDGTATVLFDHEFIRGTNLNQRCSDMRGMSGLPLNELLNLSRNTQQSHHHTRENQKSNVTPSHQFSNRNRVPGNHSPQPNKDLFKQGTNDQPNFGQISLLKRSGDTSDISPTDFPSGPQLNGSNNIQNWQEQNQPDQKWEEQEQIQEQKQQNNTYNQQKRAQAHPSQEINQRPQQQNHQQRHQQGRQQHSPKMQQQKHKQELQEQNQQHFQSNQQHQQQHQQHQRHQHHQYKQHQQYQQQHQQQQQQQQHQQQQHQQQQRQQQQHQHHQQHQQHQQHQHQHQQQQQHHHHQQQQHQQQHQQHHQHEEQQQQHQQEQQQPQRRYSEQSQHIHNPQRFQQQQQQHQQQQKQPKRSQQRPSSQQSQQMRAQTQGHPNAQQEMQPQNQHQPQSQHFQQKRSKQPNRNQETRSGVTQHPQVENNFPAQLELQQPVFFQTPISPVIAYPLVDVHVIPPPMVPTAYMSPQLNWQQQQLLGQEVPFQYPQARPPKQGRNKTRNPNYHQPHGGYVTDLHQPQKIENDPQQMPQDPSQDTPSQLTWQQRKMFQTS